MPAEHDHSVDRGDVRKHRDVVANALQDSAERVRVLDLPGLPPKGDVSDWIEAGGESHGPQQAKVIFLESKIGIANRAKPARGQIFPAADVIDHFVGDGIEKQSVDREVAAFGVLL